MDCYYIILHGLQPDSLFGNWTFTLFHILLAFLLCALKMICNQGEASGRGAAAYPLQMVIFENALLRLLLSLCGL